MSAERLELDELVEYWTFLNGTPDPAARQVGAGSPAESRGAGRAFGRKLLVF